MSKTYAKLDYCKGRQFRLYYCPFFANQIELFLSNNNKYTITVDQISMYSLLFADDAVFFSETPKGFQKSLDYLFEYYDRWKLNVNVEKSIYI